MPLCSLCGSENCALVKLGKSDAFRDGNVVREGQLDCLAHWVTHPFKDIILVPHFNLYHFQGAWSSCAHQQRLVKEHLKNVIWETQSWYRFMLAK